jgi:putative transposase
VKHWLEINQAAELLNISPRQVLNRLAEFRTMQQDGRNGRKKTLIHLSSLPPQCQVDWYERSGQDSPENLRGWESLSEESRQTALQRLDLVRQARRITETTGYGIRRQQLEDLAAASEVSLKTLYQYIAWYEEGRLEKSTGQQLTGLLSLAPAYGKNRGKYLSITPEMQDFIRGLWLKPNRPSAAYVYYQLQIWCKGKNIALPAERTVYRFINSIPKAVSTACRIGRKAYSDRYEPVIRRDISGLAPNELWVGDHREHDCFVYVSENRVQIKRVWMTAWWDLASAKLVGACWTFNPSSRSIAIAFRNGVLSHGLPTGVYIDNGKDYRSHLISGSSKKLGTIDFDSETKGILSTLKVGIIHAIPYSARSKPIERWFRLWSEGFDSYLPGWCGRNNKERPEKLAAEIKSGQLITMLEFRDMALQYREKLDAIPYGNRKKSPKEYYQNLKITTVDPDVLDLLLMEKKRVKVASYGIQAFNGLFYRSDQLMRTVLVGQYVTVRYDPDDLTSIVAWTEDGRVIGRIPLETASAMTAKGIDIDAVKAVQRYRKAQTELLGQHRSSVKYDDEFEQALAIVRQQREERQKDREKPKQEPGAVPGTLRFFPKNVQQLASEVVEAKPQEQSESVVVPMFYKKASGDDVHQPEDETYTPIFEEE